MSFSDKGAEDQARLRERLNPGWKRALKIHRESLGICDETKGMGARQIIDRALKKQGYAPRKKRKRL